MKVGIPRERRAGETRVAGSPDMVKKLVAMGVEIVVETGAGDGAGLSDDDFTEAGATIVADAKSVYGATQCLFSHLLPRRQAPDSTHKFVYTNIPWFPGS